MGRQQLMTGKKKNIPLLSQVTFLLVAAHFFTFLEKNGVVTFLPILSRQKLSMCLSQRHIFLEAEVLSLWSFSTMSCAIHITSDLVLILFSIF